MKTEVDRPFFALSFMIMVSVVIAIALTIAYYLCHINPEIESGWLRGLWHGSNLGQNYVLSFFDGRLLKAPLHSSAYSFFWWVSSIFTCLFWFNVVRESIGLFINENKKNHQVKNHIKLPVKKPIDPPVKYPIKHPVTKATEPQVTKTTDFQIKATVQKGVSNITRRARGTEIPKRAQRVFFCCDARNSNDKDALIADLLSHDAGMDCVVSWIETPGENFDKELLRNELQDTQALVLWVTKDLLQAMYENKFPVEYLIAQELRTPVLPIATYGELFPEFTRLAGAIHGIAQSDSEYRTKLKDQMETFLASEEVIKQIQEKAFTAEIFLSYRKMDIQEARKFMKAFHDLEEFEAISIWYDNFLTAGRNFDYEIKESITKCNAFVLLVTPNLATEGNYVQTTEYPFAQQEEKPVVSVETIPTDFVLFAELFPGTEKPVLLNDPVALSTSFQSKLDKSAYQWQMDSERAWLLGMAYFKGFGVERDMDRSIRLLEIAAKDCNEYALHAIRILASIYENGIGIAINYDKELYWRKKDTDYCERLFGFEHPETASAYNDIAMVYTNQSNYGKALEYFGKALSIREKVLGAAHPSTASTYNNIAGVYDKQVDFGKALEYYRKALAIHEKVLGTANPETANIYNNIAVVYYNQSDFGKALEYHGKALAIREKVLGTTHQHTANSYNNMASVFDKQGNYIKALEYFEKALANQEKVLGTAHPYTSNTYNNMGEVYINRGDYGKALEYFRKALAIREKVLGTTHPSTATIYNNMATIYDKQGDYGKALEYFGKALAIREKVLGTEHSQTATTYNNIAGVYNKQGDYGKALEYFKKALTIREKVLGTEHPNTAQTYNNIAVVYDNRNDNSKALEYHGKALAIREKVLGTEHPDTATSYNNIAMVYIKQKYYGKALNYLEKALAIQEMVLGAAHLDTATTYNNLAMVYYSQGDFGKGLEWHLKSFLAFREVLGHGHPNTKTIYNTLAFAYKKSGNREPFEMWMRKKTAR